VPAAAVVGEAAVAFLLASAVLEKFGGDTVDDLEAAWRHAATRMRTRLTAQVQEVLEAGGRDEGGPRAAPFAPGNQSS